VVGNVLFSLAVLGATGVALYTMVRILKSAILLRGRVRGSVLRTAAHSVADLSSQEFEEYVAWLFGRQGYLVRRHGGEARGFNLTLYKDGERAAVRTVRSRLADPVPAHEVRAFYGSIAHQSYTRGYLVTSSHFSDEARAWARARPDLTLINAAGLLDLRAHTEQRRLRTYLQGWWYLR
jgi:restriction endonuclease Mrr